MSIDANDNQFNSNLMPLLGIDLNHYQCSGQFKLNMDLHYDLSSIFLLILLLYKNGQRFERTTHSNKMPMAFKICPEFI